VCGCVLVSGACACVCVCACAVRVCVHTLDMNTKEHNRHAHTRTHIIIHGVGARQTGAIGSFFARFNGLGISIHQNRNKNIWGIQSVAVCFSVLQCVAVMGT